MIMSEPPATTDKQRAERADFLFGLGLRAVHFAAGLVLAMHMGLHGGLGYVQG